jgi:hypothetical protein
MVDSSKDSDLVLLLLFSRLLDENSDPYIGKKLHDSLRYRLRNSEFDDPDIRYLLEEQIFRKPRRRFSKEREYEIREIAEDVLQRFQSATPESTLMKFSSFESRLKDIETKLNKTIKQETMMDALTFFAGLQAIAAFLQVWQGERDANKAAKHYYEARDLAKKDPEIIAKAARLEANIESHPVIGKLLENRFGRCEDDFENALRREEEEKLSDAASEYVKCKCLIIDAIRVAQGGLGDELQDEWEKYKCEIVIA